MMKFTASVVISASLLGVANAECPNACSSHGICTNYDMCQCYRNWMANDCSERVCQFGLAHVDTPKGDLDASSGALAGPGTSVIENSEVYPYGTTEQFPQMVNSQGIVLENTAHYYMECSNKGLCDRQSGVCECFPGYEGSSCQRASCPSSSEGVCSGHGTCQSIKEISTKDYENIYELWDKSATLGCDCDAGYYGADCSLRHCKVGVDPLYHDDELATPRFANFSFGWYTDASTAISGNYSIVFYDVHGEDWRTEAIDADDECPEIISKLEGLPNDVIPDNSILCLEQDPATALANRAPSGRYYHKLTTLVFAGNPGKIRQMEIDTYLDGPRPTLVSAETTSTFGTFVYTNGFHGESIDYVSDYCEGVRVKLDPVAHRIIGLDTTETILLKRCLGSADFDTTNNEDEVYNWDYGTDEYPHLVKFVESELAYSRICNSTDTYFPPKNGVGWCYNKEPAGFYAPLAFDSSDGYFYFHNNLLHTYSVDTEFRVFTTKGTLQRVHNTDDGISYPAVFGNTVTYTASTGDVDAMDCETRTTTPGACLSKGDRVMFFNPGSLSNPEYHNMYTVMKVGRSRNPTTYAPLTEIVLDMGVNFGHISSMYVYKFTPSGGASYAAECSDRGVCDTSSGLCKCFKGYTLDDCSVQNTLAK